MGAEKSDIFCVSFSEVGPSSSGLDGVAPVLLAGVGDSEGGIDLLLVLTRRGDLGRLDVMLADVADMKLEFAALRKEAGRARRIR